jgi:hypothetical protein
MNLEDRYKAASADTYVGKVREQQASGAAGFGVNFMDGQGRGVWDPSVTAAPDQYQEEFKKNASGDFRYDGGGKVPGTSYTLSRWLDRGLEKGDEYFTNNKFTTIIAGDTRNGPGRLVHAFSPLPGKTFSESAILSTFGKGRLSGGASGPTPGGLNG